MDRLKPDAQGANPLGHGRCRLPPAVLSGTNIVAVVPGTDLADEYVVVGAHYDHVAARATPRSRPTPSATAPPTTPRASPPWWPSPTSWPPTPPAARWSSPSGTPKRTAWSVWHYVAHPLMPLADTVAYVNLDIQGANLLPSLREHHVRGGVGDRWAGPPGLLAGAAQRSPLDVGILSNVFGAGLQRPDLVHRRRCPQRVPDRLGRRLLPHRPGRRERGRLGKLERQRLMLLDLVGQLASSGQVAAFVGTSPTTVRRRRGVPGGLIGPGPT